MAYVPHFSNLVEMLECSVERFGERPLFGTKSGSGWVWLSYRDFFEQVQRCSALLCSLGVSRGDRVAIISNNRVEWPVTAYAAHRIGAVVVPMYEMQLDDDWRLILTDSEARVCFVANDSIARRIEDMRPSLHRLTQVVDFTGTVSKRAFPFLMEHATGSVPERVLPRPDDCAYFFYTSGTTGKPKGVELTHFNVAANASAISGLVPMGEADRSLAFLPWAHVFGGATEMNVLIAVGGAMAICESTDKIVAYLAEVRPTVLVSVPRVWNRIYSVLQQQLAHKPKLMQAVFHAGMNGRAKRNRNERVTFVERLCIPFFEKLILPKVKSRFGGCLRYAISGAAALSPEVAEFIDNLGIEVYEAYGLTEVSSGAAANCPAEKKIGSVGKPLPGVEIKLDERLGTKQGEGEIIIYGTGVMAGYHNRPDLTREVMTEDGGLRTGDLGHFDEEGFLFITGRIKDLFKLENGKYVAPAHVEEQMTLSPFIAQAMICGADKLYTVALVVPDFERLDEWAAECGLSKSREELLTDPSVNAHYHAEIDTFTAGGRGYERPREFALLREAFSVENNLLTPTLKVKRRNVETRYLKQIDAIYDQAGS